MEQIQAVAPNQAPEYMEYPTTGGSQIRFNNLSEKVVNFVDKVTSVPEYIDRVGDNVNDKLVDFFTGLKRDSTQKIEDNLTKQKTASIGRNLGSWLGQGNNLMYAGAGLILLIIFLVRR